MAKGLTGVSEMKRTLERLAAQAQQNARKAAQSEMGQILETAKARTPVATGQLRDSGRVVPADTDDTAIRVGITFDAPHAVYVHEDLDAEHATGQAKFLESALNEAAPTLARRIAAHIKLK